MKILAVLSHFTVPSLLKSVDIIILSSKHEGLSLASIEALASGKPFIASDAPGLNEVVKIMAYFSLLEIHKN